MKEYSDTDWKRYRDVSAQAGTWFSRLSAEFTKERRVKYLGTLERTLQRFSPGERFMLYVLSALLGFAALMLLAGLNAAASVAIPSSGGSITEGEVGPVRFINPLLTMSQPDQDLTALVYSGLVRALPDGSIVPDLAQSYTISADGRVYTFKLRPGATFQNGTPVTAADVLFTVQEAQDPDIDSPLSADWQGVAASSPDPETVVFTLAHPYAPFIYDATMGILPKALWQNVSAEEFPFSPLNTHPVGSGPYEISNVAVDSTGSATRYDLVPFNNYALGAPYLSRISFVFFSDNDSLLKAFNAGQINAIAGIDPSDLAQVKSSGAEAATVPLPRDFGVFFNQSHNPVLADASVRAALNAAVDKQALVNTVLNGEGEILNGPIPPELLGNVALAVPQPIGNVIHAAASTSEATSSAYAQAAQAILQKGGWTFDTKTNTWEKNKTTLTFRLATADQPELVATAQALAADWQAAGITVSVQVYPISELNNTIIRPRNYDALLFGEVVGPELDLYAFWDSSQKSDPGLNLAMYGTTQTDALLSQARATTNTQTRNQLYEQFAALLQKDMPAIFLYEPDFIYVLHSGVQGIELGALSTPADRFENVYQWYANTENVWAIFAPTQTTSVN